MPFRSIVAEPNELSKLTAAFDAAWMGINSVETIGAVAQKRRASAPRRQQRARLQLPPLQDVLFDLAIQGATASLQVAASRFAKLASLL